ncbi:MAG: hypothetical protein CM1200mP41_36430 [Gammaproteobacteria bacterium]|nr:MAG: hypothetical protein CM1200mP41_36430 [Gammaproteobacteria bacterium]
MLAVPVAAVGGIGGLAALNLVTYQALDMLTMLGFVILIGIVVNNAILLSTRLCFTFAQRTPLPVKRLSVPHETGFDPSSCRP